MFKVENHVPEYYLKESRDFQLFPRLDDILFMGQHYEASTINELNNPKKCKNLYLKYLAEKVGFYTDKYIPDKVLINIISAFRTAVKNKGTEKGVEQAVIAILKAENSVEEPKFVITTNNLKDEWEQYTINIYTPVKILNEVALREFLKYIIPSGYNYNIYAYDNADIEDRVVEVNTTNKIDWIITNPSNIGVIRKDIQEYSKDSDNKDDDYYNKLLQDRLIGTADIGIVIAPEDIKFTGVDNLETLDTQPFVTFKSFAYLTQDDYKDIPSGVDTFYIYDVKDNVYKVYNEGALRLGNIYYYPATKNDMSAIKTTDDNVVISNIILQGSNIILQGSESNI